MLVFIYSEPVTEYRRGKAMYPHQLTPTQMDLQWEDFSLPGCAKGDDEKPTKSNFLEYPIIPGDSAWSGGNVKQGEYRVVFQSVDSQTAAFCGIMRHPGKDGVQNHFQLCEDPPHTGRCGVHVIQVQVLLPPPLSSSPSIP